MSPSETVFDISRDPMRYTKCYLIGGEEVISMMFEKKQKDMVSNLFMGASILCVALAGVGYLWQDVLFASTQWMLTAAVFGLFGVYLKLLKD